MERARLRELCGKHVITRDDVVLGEVLDLELELSSWEVTWLFIALDRAVTDRFHVDAPLRVGTRAIALSPGHVQSISREAVRLRSTLTDVVIDAVVSFDTDVTRHLGSSVR